MPVVSSKITSLKSLFFTHHSGWCRNVGLRTLNGRINQIEPLTRCLHTGLLTDVPPVIQLDGIWVTIITQHETIKPDKRQRQRKKRTGRKMVILVALGFWTDGRREILDWQIARSENH